MTSLIHIFCQSPVYMSFWCNLLDPRYEDMLWKIHFHRLFPNAPASLTLAEAHQDCCKLMILRNQVAHFEPVFYQSLPRTYSLLKEVTGWISEEMRDWLSSHNDKTVLAIINKKPKTEPAVEK